MEIEIVNTLQVILTMVRDLILKGKNTDAATFRRLQMEFLLSWFIR